MDNYESPSAEEHRERAPHRLTCAVITVSDTRTEADDRSGGAIIQLLEAAGHSVSGRTIVPDDPAAIRGAVADQAAREAVDAVFITGGTGIASRDQTADVLASMFTKLLPGFGELFRLLSYQEIGAAAMLSRGRGGLIGRTPVLLMPGSTAAVRLAMEKLIVPELGIWSSKRDASTHLVKRSGNLREAARIDPDGLRFHGKFSG